MLVEALEPRRLLSVATVDGRHVEGLDRGMVAVNQGGGKVYVGWRLLATDPDDVTFNLYRSTAGGVPVKLNATPLGQTTDFVNTGVNVASGNAYFVRPVIDGAEQANSAAFTLPANAPTQSFLSVPLQIPPGGTTPTGEAYTYSANDTSVADLDGDGDYEFIVKWDPSNAKDNAQDGYTGNVYVDAYKLDGTRMWRIDLGRNIRAGAHYTQFMAYDLDSDGRAEVAMKTADGTRDGVGTVIGSATADYRNTAGRILTGPEFLTVFDGQTGAALATTNYLPARGTVSSWGDSYGNRVDRFLACVAYLDGQRPSLVMTRGYYTRSVLVAWDWRGGQLTRRWTFDSNVVGNNTAGQGNHNLSVADVDADGRDEIVFGAMTVGDNGALLYNTRLGHGDAMHVSDMDPDRPGLEVFKVNESPSQYGTYGGALWDAANGTILSHVPGTGDVGRGVAFDIDPRYRGFEMWSSGDGGLYNVDGTRIQDRGNAFYNFGLWWDADPLRELLDGTTIADWRIGSNGVGGRVNYVFAPAGVSSNNGTKSTPSLSGDILGDWREEVVWRQSDNTALQIWTTTMPAAFRLDTLVHDSQYRLSLAWQNVAYNQPPHTSFYLGDGMLMPPAAPTGVAATAASHQTINLSWAASAGATGYSVKRATSPTGPYTTVAAGLTSTSYADVGLTPQRTYYYLVTAVNAAGGSLNANGASATTPADPPLRVTNVFVAGTAWTSAYRNSLQASGDGEAAWGYRIKAGEQWRTLGWTNLNQVSVRFGEHVNVAADDLVVNGINVASYLTGGAAAFTYDPVTFTARWTLSRAIPNDKVTLNLDGDHGVDGTGVTDAAGNLLDGEWTNPAYPSMSGDAFPSGDGTAGGDFVFAFRVLPGDVNRDGAVNVFDYNVLRPNLNQANKGVTGGDINGDGLVSIVDYNEYRFYLNRTTPT